MTQLLEDLLEDLLDEVRAQRASIESLEARLGLGARKVQYKMLRCTQCGVEHPVGVGTRRRSDAKYCSGNCRTAAYQARERKKKAAMLSEPQSIG